MYFCGFPIFGWWLPFLGWRKIPLNRDGTITDTGKVDMLDEVGFYYAEQLCFEWWGLNVGLLPAPVRVWSTGKIADPAPDWLTKK